MFHFDLNEATSDFVMVMLMIIEEKFLFVKFIKVSIIVETSWSLVVMNQFYSWVDFNLLTCSLKSYPIQIQVLVAFFLLNIRFTVDSIRMGIDLSE